MTCDLYSTEIDLTAVTGSDAITDTHTEELGLGGPCTKSNLESQCAYFLYLNQGSGIIAYSYLKRWLLYTPEEGDRFSSSQEGGAYMGGDSGVNI